MTILPWGEDECLAWFTDIPHDDNRPIHGIDTTTLQVVRTLDVGQVGDDLIWGVAVDFDGFHR